jgi:hypothetical protein
MGHKKHSCGAAMQARRRTCVLCNTGCEETSFHLFFECPFTQDCWNTIPINWNLNLPPLDMVIEVRSDFGNPLFIEIFITACWIIWTTRNGAIFDHGQININIWRGEFKKERGLTASKRINSYCRKGKISPFLYI